MKYKLLFLTPFATSNIEVKTFRNLLNTFAIVMLLGTNGMMGQSTVPSAFSLSGGNFSLTAYTGTSFPTNMAIGFENNSTDGTFNTDLILDVVNGNAAGQWDDEAASGISYGASSSSSRGSFLFRCVSTGRTNIQVGWVVRDIIVAANTNYIELQWRSGASGTWNDVSGDIYQQGTTANGTSFSVTLPSGAENLSDLRVRWIYYEIGSGSRDRLAIDEISITSNGTASLTPPTLTAAVSATVDSAFDVTFTDANSFQSNITGITVGGTQLTAGYVIGTNKITFTPSASIPAGLLQTAGASKSIVVSATGFSASTVAQTIGVGADSKLAISVQPTAPATNGGALAQQPTVLIQDQYGNTTTSTATVTATAVQGTWTAGGSNTKAGVAGSAAFSGLTATSVAAVTGATVTFTSGSLTSVTSSAFNIPAPPPTNDDCSNATTLTAGAAATSGNNALASKSNPTSLTESAYNTGTAKDIWYIFTPTCSGSHTITLTPSVFDGAVALFTAGSCPNPTFTSVADAGGSGVAETITFNATANTTYRILVWGYNSASGSFTIGVTTPTLAVTTSATSSINTTGATLNGNVNTLCPNITEIGFVYSLTSTNNNPLNAGTGVTKVSVTSVEGAFTNTLTGLTTSVGYSYKAYAFDGTTYTYGSVQTFTPSNVPAIIYQHDFGTTGITSKPYTGAPGTFASNLSNSSWTASGAFTDLNGSTGKAIGFSAVSSGPYTLTFNVANGYQLSVSSYSYWRQTSSSASVSSITINGTTITSGASAAPTTGTNIGTTNVANTISGLTGTITVIINITGSGSFRLDDFTLNGNVFETTNTWTGGTGNWNTAANWSFSQVPLTTDNITISGGSPVLDVDFTLPAGKTLTLSGTGNLTIAPGKILTIAGTADFGGKAVTFKSDATGSGMFGPLTGTLTGATNVKVERYIPAKRAYRFLSSSVNTLTTTIRQNWQEDAINTAGFGTHITGTGGADNGFDTTATNNPSLYTFNNTSGAWEAVTSTLTNFTAGTPYRLMVRGDRLINLSTNTPTATETVLRATGTLHTGNFSPTLNQAAEGFSFVGNPYQAPVNIKTVLDAATNMNTGVVYYWDPTLNARGGYVTRDLTNNNNNVMSNFNQYLQPGQAVFVKKANTASAASVTITESHKSVANGAAGVFRTTSPNDYGLLRVNLQANTNNQWQTIEGTLALFNDNFSWNVTSEDATKMSNLDEEVSFVQNNTSLAIACVSAPSVTSELPIQLNNLRHSNYQWQFELANYQGERPYLYDTQNNTYTEITNGTTVPFTATTAAANRFKIVFQNSTLGIDDFTYGLVLYPNPAKAGDSFYVQGSTAAEVTVYNVLGQHIPVQVKSQGNALQVTPMQTLSQGIYLVTVTTEGKTQHVKWIVE
jgi:hypothetical protein